jgi:hydrogenase maturation protease
VVIGVGNPHRGDDSLGLVIARMLKERVPDSVAVHENYGEPCMMMEAMEDTKLVIFIDAVLSGAEPGRIIRFDASTEKLPAESFKYSSHAFSIPQALELARAMEHLPPKAVVFGVEGKDFGTGDGLSPEVNAALAQVVDMVLKEIDETEL